MSQDPFFALLVATPVLLACLGFAVVMTAIGIAMMFGGPTLAARAARWWLINPLRLLAGVVIVQLLSLPQLILNVLVDPALQPIVRMLRLLVRL